MARRASSTSASRNKSNELAAKLIAAGLLLGLLPLILGKSEILAAFRPMVPVGWFLVVVGFGMLAWPRVRSAPRTASPPDTPPTLRRPVGYAPDLSMPAEKIFAELNRTLGNAKQQVCPPPKAPVTWGKEVFDVIEWRRFEALVEALFTQAGFETKSQPHGADEGIDIWLYSRNNPGAPVSVVQCKHWHGKKVGVDKVRELRGVMAAKSVARGQFATTSTFTVSGKPPEFLLTRPACASPSAAGCRRTAPSTAWA